MISQGSTNTLPVWTASACAICGAGTANVLRVREMLMGLQEVFEYGYCRQCGAIARLSRVHNMSKYYPAHYYSFAQSHQTKMGVGIAQLRKIRDRALLTGRNGLLKQAISQLGGEHLSTYGIIGKVGLTRTSRVVDIGCGSGALLKRMAELGFRSLLGIDLFLPDHAEYHEKNLQIIRGGPEHLTGLRFDCIMLHHCFEHFDDQQSMLRVLRDLLAPGGTILIRQPVCDSKAYHTYGVHWFQLDAPRHSVIHSVESMTQLATQCGLSVKEVVWDSNDQQFWASEQYQKGIPMYSEKSYLCNPDKSIFSSEQISAWKREALVLNATSAGDQAAFLLKRAASSQRLATGFL